VEGVFMKQLKFSSVLLVAFLFLSVAFSENASAGSITLVIRHKGTSVPIPVVSSETIFDLKVHIYSGLTSVNPKDVPSPETMVIIHKGKVLLNDDGYSHDNLIHDYSLYDGDQIHVLPEASKRE
jgi:hypothetical protein